MMTKIGVIGSGDDDPELNKIALQVGKEVAKKGCVLVCGGLGGVMEAACKGSKLEGGITVGILPGEDKTQANKYVDITITTGMGYARNAIVVLSSDVLIAIGGRFGTLSEISLAHKFEIPVVGLNTWDISSNIVKCNDAKEAVKLAYNLTNSN